MSCHKAMLESLHQQGIRLTAQRALILEDLYHNPGHRTAEEIFQGVSDRLPGLNRATVYRTLEMLHSAQLVTLFNGPEGITRYELVRTADDQHHHLVCQRCGAEYALDAAPVARLAREIQERTGFRANFSHLIIRGLCAGCAGSPLPEAGPPGV